MIYLDNSATTLQKPPEVGRAVMEAIQTFGNPGRSFCAPSMDAARAVHDTRREIAALAGLQNPLGVAFTSGATESLNLVLASLITEQDGVITTVLEHNSVLRPLYRIGCDLTFLSCDDSGQLLLEDLEKALQPNTRFLVCAHGSNFCGSIADTKELGRFCREKGLTFILDASQTLGCVETLADMADVLCFTGHKALLGPQGTGGIITERKAGFPSVKTGGSGSDSFATRQSSEMPEVFEAGTQNAHSLAGLGQGAAYVSRLSVDAVAEHGMQLLELFLGRISELPGLHLYGTGPELKGTRLPVVALNLADMPSEELAQRLWEGWGIATRAGSHCAPLAHKRFGTGLRGAVRFSFSVFNTRDEIEVAASALQKLAYSQ